MLCGRRNNAMRAPWWCGYLVVLIKCFPDIDLVVLSRKGIFQFHISPWTPAGSYWLGSAKPKATKIAGLTDFSLTCPPHLLQHSSSSTYLFLPYDIVPKERAHRVTSTDPARNYGRPRHTQLGLMVIVALITFAATYGWLMPLTPSQSNVWYA